jgi:hypothetical protein
MLATAPLTDAALAAYLNTAPANVGLDPQYLAVAPWGAWGDVLSDLEHLAIWVQEPHDVIDVQGLIVYFLTGPAAFGGEWTLGPVLDAPNGGQIFCFGVDGTKSAHDDIAWYISDHFETYLQDGTPIRKTDKAGPGTKGTRKWPGLHGPYAVAWR